MFIFDLYADRHFTLYIQRQRDSWEFLFYRELTFTGIFTHYNLSATGFTALFIRDWTFESIFCVIMITKIYKYDKIYPAEFVVSSGRIGILKLLALKLLSTLNNFNY